LLEIEELAGPIKGISSVDVKQITPKVISNVFEYIVHKKCVYEQLYKDNRDILNKPGKNVVFPEAKTAGAFYVNYPEFVDVTTIATSATVGFGTIGATTIGVVKLAGYFNVTREAIKFGMRDVIKDNIWEVGMEYKEAINNMAYYQMMFGLNTIQAFSSRTLSSGDTLGLAGSATSIATAGDVMELSITPAAIANSIASTGYMDYRRGTMHWAGSSIVLGADCTVYFRQATKPGYSRNASQLGSTGTGILGWGLLDGKAAMVGQGRDPDVAVLNYADIPNVLYDTKISFLDASAYGDREPLMNAEIGKLWGLKIITESRRMPRGAAVVVDTSRMGYDVHKEELRSYREDVYKRDAVFYYFYSERGFGVRDTLAVCAVLGGTPTYRSTNPVS